MKLVQSFRVVTLWTAACFAASVGATDFPKEGKYDHTACWAGASTVVSFSKTHNGGSYEFTGTTVSNPRGGIFDKWSFHCAGSWATFDKKFIGMVTCVELNLDGDKLLTFFRAGDDRKYVRETIAGTGKFEGIVMQSKLEDLGPFPAVKPGNFQGCNHQTGTYKLK